MRHLRFEQNIHSKKQAAMGLSWNHWLCFLTIMAVFLSWPSGLGAFPAIDEWEQMYSPHHALHGVWVSAGGHAYAVGSGGKMDVYNGASWSQQTIGPNVHLLDIWGSSESDIFVVGEAGNILHYNGFSWSSMTSPTTQRLMGVWGSSGSDVFAVGYNGTILRYDGFSWSQMTSPTTQRLMGVWGSSGTNVFAVGEGGVILIYDGSDWTAMTSGVTARLNGVWGSAVNNVLAVGDGGTILQYNGSSWSSMTSNTTAGLVDIWGASATDIFTAGEGGTILYYDGTSWKSMNSGGSWMMQGIYGSSGADVFVVTYGGPVLHYPPRVFEISGTYEVTKIEGEGTWSLNYPYNPLTGWMKFYVTLHGHIECSYTYTVELYTGAGGGWAGWKGASIVAIGTATINGDEHEFGGFQAGDLENYVLGDAVGGLGGPWTRTWSNTISGTLNQSHGWAVSMALGSKYTADLAWQGSNNGNMIAYADGTWRLIDTPTPGIGSGTWSGIATRSFAGQLSDVTIGEGSIEAFGSPKYGEIIYDVNADGTFIITHYSSNPGDAPPKPGLGKFLQIDTNIPYPDITFPVELRLHYQDEELIASGIEENSLQMYRWDGTAWTVVADTGVNTTDNYVWAKLNNFSTYSALGDPAVDFGDAPDPTYPTLLASDGARHTAAGPTLGPNRDSEADGQPVANADGDDTAALPDDEDGITPFTSMLALTSGTSTGTVHVNLQHADPSSNRLDAWVDFNRDGDWNDAGEQIFTDYDLGVTDGDQMLTFTIPQAGGGAVAAGKTYARFRLSTSGGLAPTGAAVDGEVEDYAVTINIDGWSDDFESGTPGSSRQTWIPINGGDNSVDSFTGGRYVLHTEDFNTGDTVFKEFIAYVEGNASDAVIKANIADTGSDFSAALFLRGNVETNSSYVAIIGVKSGKLYLFKRSGGVSTPLASADVSSVNLANCWLKFAVMGDKLFAKAWSDGSAEPSVWTLEYEDTGITILNGHGGISILAVDPEQGQFTPSEAAFDNVSLTTDMSSFCDAHTLTPGVRQFTTSAATSQTVAVDAAYDFCQWTAVSNDPSWITVTSGADYTGDDAVSYNVMENTNQASRTGTLTIAGETHRVLQCGAGGVEEWRDDFDGGSSDETWVEVADIGTGNNAALANDRYEFQVSGGSGNMLFETVFGVATDAIFQGRVQEINAGQPFIAAVLLRGNMTTGDGYAVAVSTDSSFISISKTIGGVRTQLAALPVTADLTDFNIKCAVIGNTIYARVWNGGSEPATWDITATDGDLAFGGCAIGVFSLGDPGAAAFDDVSLTTDLSGLCFATLSREMATFNQAGGTGSVAVDASFDYCQWTATSNVPAWISITSGENYTGDKTVSYTVQANAGKASREGTLTIAGNTFTVYQCGVGGVEEWRDDFDANTPDQTWVQAANVGTNCTATVVNERYEFHVEPNNAMRFQTVMKIASDGIFQGRVRQIAPGDHFIATAILRGDLATGNAYSVSVADGPVTAYILIRKTVGGTPTDLVQLPLSMDVTDFQLKFAAIGANLYAKVWGTGQTEPKEWTIQATDSDLTFGGCAIGVASGGYPTAQVAFDDVSFTTELSGLCAYSLAPPVQSVNNSAGSKSFAITAYPTGCLKCEWTAVSNDPAWLNVDTGSESGTGNGTVNYSYTANAANSPRTGTIDIKDRGVLKETFSLKQGGQPLWSETYSDADGYDQTWGWVDSDTPITTLTRISIGGRFEIRMNDGGIPDDKFAGAVVDTSVEDGIIQARFTGISAYFMADLWLRQDEDTKSGYGFGWNDQGHIWLGKRINGLGEALVVKQFTTHDPTDCMVRFAAIGNKLFGKIWTNGTPEPENWMIEYTLNPADSDYLTTGRAGVGMFTWYINNFYIASGEGAFDDVSLSAADSFWIESETSTGQNVAGLAEATVAVGDSEIDVDSSSADPAFVTIVDSNEEPFNKYTGGIYGSEMINKQVLVASDLPDGAHKTVVKLHYADADVAGINELDLRMFYWSDMYASRRYAVSGNINPPADPETTWRGNMAVPNIASAVLGDHGVDTAGNILWAVVDHYSDFNLGKANVEGWSLQNANRMKWGDDNEPASTVPLGPGATYVWVADTQAAVETNYINDSWTGQISFGQSVPSTDTFTVDVGHCTTDPGNFTVGAPNATITGQGMPKVYGFDTGADGILTVPAGRYAAMRITNNSAATYTVLTGGLTSWLNSPGACTYTLTPASVSVGAEGATGWTVAVDALLAVCQWTAVSNDAWIGITSGASYTGDKTVTYNVSPNATAAVRTGSMTVAGRTFSVTQAGALGSWSDAFNGGAAQQTWTDVGGPHTVNAGEYMELSKTNGHLTAYVNNTDVGDGIITAQVQSLTAGSAYLSLRYAGSDSGYLFGITDVGDAFIAKRTNGSDEILKEYQGLVSSPINCWLKFAVVGEKLFGKAWKDGDSEPCAWQMEASDSDFSSGDAGVGVSASGTTVDAAFDNIVFTTNLAFFYQNSGTCGGAVIPPDGTATVSAGGSGVTIDSNDGDTHTISVSEETGAPVNPGRGLFAGNLIDKHVEVNCSLNDGEFTAVIRLYYTDAEIAGINEMDLRLYYYDETSAAWILAVDGNTTGGAAFRGNSAPTGVLGDYGVNAANNIVWAVVDHFTSFGSGGTGTGAWVLQSNHTGSDYLMRQGDSSQSLTQVSMGAGPAYVWVADAPAATNTTFTNPFGGQLMFQNVSTSGNYSVTVGSWVGGTFTPSTITGTVALAVAPGDVLYDMDLLATFPAGSFTVNAGEYLALRLTNNTGAAQTLLTGGLRSWLNATNSDNNPYPTVITLTAFTAEETETGILLKWHTESEVENAGFHIWRSMEEDTGYLRITGNLIPAEGSETRPADYAYTDTTAQPDIRYFYKLEDIGNDGVSTLHGPVSVNDNVMENQEEIGGDEDGETTEPGAGDGNGLPADEEEDALNPGDSTPPGGQNGNNGDAETPSGNGTSADTEPGADQPDNVLPSGDEDNGDTNAADQGEGPQENDHSSADNTETDGQAQPSSASDETTPARKSGGDDSNCFIGSLMGR